MEKIVQIDGSSLGWTVISNESTGELIDDCGMRVWVPR